MQYDTFRAKDQLILLFKEKKKKKIRLDFVVLLYGIQIFVLHFEYSKCRWKNGDKTQSIQWTATFYSNSTRHVLMLMLRAVNIRQSATVRLFLLRQLNRTLCHSLQSVAVKNANFFFAQTTISFVQRQYCLKLFIAPNINFSVYVLLWACHMYLKYFQFSIVPRIVKASKYTHNGNRTALSVSLDTLEIVPPASSMLEIREKHYKSGSYEWEANKKSEFSKEKATIWCKRSSNFTCTRTSIGKKWWNGKMIKWWIDNKIDFNLELCDFVLWTLSILFDQEKMSFQTQPQFN